MWRQVLFVIIALPCLAQTEAADIQRIFRKGLELQQKGDLEGAIDAYRQLLQIRPDVPPAHANLGVVLARLGRYQEAISHYRDALKGGENPATRLNLALAYYKLGELSRAAQEFEKVQAEQQGNVQANDLAADCYLRLGENKRVIALLEPLAAHQPNDLTLEYLLGTALIRDHQVVKGRQVIDRILQHGENAGANLLFAQLALADENYSEADARAEKAITLDPKLPDAYMLSGVAKEGLGDYKGARSAFERCLQLDPNGFDSNLHLGALMLRDSDLESAQRFTATALRLRPSSPAALYQMGLIDKATGNLEEAVNAFEAAEKDSPDWLEPHVQLASLYYRLKRPEDGLRERQLVSRLSERQK
jgi:tetratricopeptide (TPR) repeat protein